MKKTVKVFDYIEELDAFLATEEYIKIASHLGLVEWTPVVWICRLFGMDNDYAEHIFDCWAEREALEEKAMALGYDESELLIIVPNRFMDKKDGPCNTDEVRKIFWTDVCKSLEISYKLLFEKARSRNGSCRPDHVEERIKSIINGEFSGEDVWDEKLADQWEEETRHLSSPAQAMEFDSIKEIMKMGKYVIPKILWRFKTKQGNCSPFWFVVVNRILGIKN